MMRKMYQNCVMSNLVQNVRRVTTATTRAVVPAASKTVCVENDIAIIAAMIDRAKVSRQRKMMFKGYRRWKLQQGQTRQKYVKMKKPYDT